MYSLVLATMLTTGTATPSWWFSCHGCEGGCHGWFHGGCHGCHGCYGCYGGAVTWDPYAAGAGYSAVGCFGCYGAACFGGGSYGTGYFGNGGGYAGASGTGAWGYGGWGHGYLGSCYGCAGGGVMYHGHAAAGIPTSPASQACVVVELPAGTRLIVDGQPVNVSGGRRLWTPALQPGRQYAYTFSAVREGKDGAPAASRRVIVRAGDEVRVDLRGSPDAMVEKSRPRVSAEQSARR